MKPRLMERRDISLPAELSRQQTRKFGTNLRVVLVPGKPRLMERREHKSAG